MAYGGGLERLRLLISAYYIHKSIQRDDTAVAPHDASFAVEYECRDGHDAMLSYKVTVLGRVGVDAYDVGTRAHRTLEIFEYGLHLAAGPAPRGVELYKCRRRARYEGVKSVLGHMITFLVVLSDIQPPRILRGGCVIRLS